MAVGNGPIARRSFGPLRRPLPSVTERNGLALLLARRGTTSATTTGPYSVGQTISGVWRPLGRSAGEAAPGRTARRVSEPFPFVVTPGRRQPVCLPDGGRSGSHT